MFAIIRSLFACFILFIYYFYLNFWTLSIDYLFIFTLYALYKIEERVKLKWN